MNLIWKIVRYQTYKKTVSLADNRVCCFLQSSKLRFGGLFMVLFSLFYRLQTRGLRDSESHNIENQRKIISKFVMLNGWIEVKAYADDSYSGGNFF